MVSVREGNASAPSRLFRLLGARAAGSGPRGRRRAFAELRRRRPARRTGWQAGSWPRAAARKPGGGPRQERGLVPTALSRGGEGRPRAPADQTGGLCRASGSRFDRRAAIRPHRRSAPVATVDEIRPELEGIDASVAKGPAGARGWVSGTVAYRGRAAPTGRGRGRCRSRSTRCTRAVRPARPRARSSATAR